MPSDADDEVILRTIQAFWDLPLTPPLSPLHQREQGTGDGGQSTNKFSQQPRTPSSHAFGTSLREKYKSVQRTIRIEDKDPFTPMNSPWQTPISSEKCPHCHGSYCPSPHCVTPRRYSGDKKMNTNERVRAEVAWRLHMAWQAQGCPGTEQSTGECHLEANRAPFLEESPSVYDFPVPEPLPQCDFQRFERQEDEENEEERPMSFLLAPPPHGPFFNHGVQARKALPKSTNTSTENFFAPAVKWKMSNQEPHSALALAENALMNAEETGIDHLIAKCQKYRGFCLLDLHRWEEASEAFTRGAGIRDWRGVAREMKNRAEQQIRLERSRKGKQRINERTEPPSSRETDTRDEAFFML